MKKRGQSQGEEGLSKRDVYKRQVFLVSEGMERFSGRLLAGEEVRELWEPALELTVYPSKTAAAQVVELVPVEELLPKGWKEREK